MLLADSLGLIWAEQKEPDFRFDFNAASTTTLAPLNGFYGLDSSNAVSKFRWTQPNFAANFDYIAHRDFHLVLHTFGNPAPNQNQSWQIQVDGQALTSFRPASSATPQSYEFDIPANLIKADQLNVQFSGPSYKPKGETRNLGLPVTYLEIRAISNQIVWPPLSVFGPSYLLSLLTLVLLIPLGQLGGVFQRTKVSFVFMFMTITLPALYIMLNRRQNSVGFATDLDNWNYTFGRIDLAEYTLLGIAGAAHLWLEWRKVGATKAADTAIAHDAKATATNLADPNQANQNSTSALTGLRYLAALLVFCNHLPIDNLMPAPIYHLFRSGYVGVSLFFVLSGFVLCYNYFDKMKQGLKQATLRSFWVARFARIYPMYLLGFLLAIPIIQPARKVWAAPFQLLLIQSFSPDQDVMLSYNPPAWSVSVEAFFYLSFPFIVFWGVRRLTSVAQILITGILLFILQTSVETIVTNAAPTLTSDLNYSRLLEYLFYDLPLGRLAEFVIGILAALLFMRWRNRPISQRERWLAHLLLIVAVCLIIYLMSLDKVTWQAYRYGTFYMVLFAYIIFWLCRYPTRISHSLSAPAMLLLGESSYAFYLLHDTVLKLSDQLVGEAGTGWGEYLTFAIQLVIVSLLSVIAFTCYEAPARFWIRRKLDGLRSTLIDQGKVG